MKAITCFIVISLFTLSAWCGRGLRCLYVSNKGGAAVYNKPSLYPPGFKFTLPYGTLVKVEEFTGKHETVVSDNKDTIAQWLKISIPDSVHLTDLFVLDVNTRPFLAEIPVDYLTNHNFVGLNDSIYIHKNITRYNTIRFARNTDDSAGCGCFMYNDIPPPQGWYETKYPYIYYSYDGISPEIAPESTILDTLKYFLKLETVDIKKYQKMKIESPYAVDTSQVQIWAPKELYNDDSYRITDVFYLLVNGGKDTLIINKVPGEYGSTKRLAGQIHKYNSYVLEETSFFNTGAILLNKSSGEKILFTQNGIPFISPNGKMVIDFCENYDHETDEIHGTLLSVSTVDDNLKIDTRVNVEFRSFIPAEDFNPFWVSNNELIIKVYPIDNFIYNQCTGSGEANYQYLNVKILKY